MQKTNKRLWNPQEKNKKQTQLYNFCNHLKINGIFDWEGDYHKLWQWSVENSSLFWSKLWDWHGIIGEKGNRILINPGKMPGSKYFPDAKLNFAENLLYEADDSIAIFTHSEDGKHLKLTRKELLDKSLALAGWMKEIGIQKGDRVVAYVPNTDVAIISMLATSSLGAVFSSCSPDFGLTGVLDRFSQINPKLLIAVDGYSYNGKKINKLDTICELIKSLPNLKNVLVSEYLDKNLNLSNIPKAINFNDALKFPPINKFVRIGFNEPLYILYSSGTTGTPKCIVHSVGGTLIQHIKEHKLHCNIFERDVMFFFTTCGWMMWNWLITGLASKSKLMLFEGNPFYPTIERLWQIASDEKVKLFGVSAKYIDAVRKSKIIPKEVANLESLEIICSTGSPLSEDGFEFVYKNIKPQIHLASISGGTDIMCCFVIGCPLLPVFSGEIQVRGLGMDVVILDENGKILKNEKGELCCKSPFPSMPIEFWNDANGEKYHEAYFNKYPNIWKHGDWATLTKNNGIIIHGRSDATLNPSGIRIGTSEIYRIVENFEEVMESLVIGQSLHNDVRIILFVRMNKNFKLSEKLISKLKNKIKSNASPRHVPAVICEVNDIPRTRSGKITELAVKDIVHGKKIKNTEALENPEALEEFKNRKELVIN